VIAKDCPFGREAALSMKAPVVSLRLATALSRFLRFEEDERLAQG
jgi:hypothetical protein